MRTHSGHKKTYLRGLHTVDRQKDIYIVCTKWTDKKRGIFTWWAHTKRTDKRDSVTGELERTGLSDW